MHRSAAVFLAGMAAIVWIGCSSDVTTKPAGLRAAYASGSRLRVVVLDGGGGAESFDGFYDTELGEPCQFRTASDGELRCLPTPDTTLRHATFADATCATPVALLPSPACGPIVHDALVPVAGSCNAFEVRAIGAALGDAPVYRMNGSCTEVQPDPGRAPFALGAVAPPSAFVRATEQREDLGGGVSRRVFVGEDGSREIVGAAYTDLGSVCRDPGEGPYAGRCAPFSALGATGQFVDASCTTPAIVGAKDACWHDDYIVAVDPALGCLGELVGVWRRGPTVTGPFFYGSKGTCQQAGEQTYESAGEPLGPDAFPALTTKSLGVGGLSVSISSTMDGVALDSSGTFHDVKRGVLCDVYELVGAGLRCIPHNRAEASELFADAACTTPVVKFDASACTPSPPIVAVRPVGDACGGLAEVDAIGSAPGSTIYSKKDGACVAEPAGGASQFYPVGTPLDPASFPSVTRVTR